MDKNNQAHLIEGCRNNDSLSQMQLYDLYCKAMFNTAYNFIKDDDIAQDVMQEAFIKAFKKIDSYTGEASFGAWLKRIVINQSLDWLKKKKIETVELKDEVTYLPNDDPWEVESEISMAAIYKCIEALPQKCKNVVKLYLLEGYDHQEVAQILQISEVSSRSQLSRGKSKLKELLIHENYES
ncbi:MAG: sigma-70 family RNA polymerase sigma factor [Flavobacteriaceae bacterium]|nr:MAG: sigma-70 family RNA polymerase sigma factor [Flavobacteriaceae bacterium]